MGFFSDLKEDLSQAVNELMPEEQLDAVLAGGEEKKDPAAAPATTVDSLDLSSMLDKLDAATPEETKKEEPEIRKEEEKPVTAEPEKTETKEHTDQPAAKEEPVKPAPQPVFKTEKPKEFGSFSTYQNSKRDGKKMDTQTKAMMDETAVVTAGMSITGDIVSQGSLELIGTVNGNIDILGKLNITGTVQGNSKAAEIYAEGAKITGEINSEGSVKIGQSSVIIGNISATSAVIAGAVKGDIDVHGPVILDTSAIVMGNIKSKSVQINNGAVIEGMCSQCYADVNPTSFFEDIKKKK